MWISGTYTGREGSQGGGKRVTSGLSESRGGGGGYREACEKREITLLQKLFSGFIFKKITYFSCTYTLFSYVKPYFFGYVFVPLS
jgi:hypothetical protein